MVTFVEQQARNVTSSNFLTAAFNFQSSYLYICCWDQRSKFIQFRVGYRIILNFAHCKRIGFWVIWYHCRKLNNMESFVIFLYVVCVLKVRGLPSKSSFLFPDFHEIQLNVNLMFNKFFGIFNKVKWAAPSDFVSSSIWRHLSESAAKDELLNTCSSARLVVY